MREMTQRGKSREEDSILFILFVRDQERSARFYRDVLELEPLLDVPGMTEFRLGRGVKLGLMPADGIVRILNGQVREPHEEAGGGGPRCELYLYVDDPDRYYDRVVRAGGRGISRGATRSWGDFVAYGSDDDGHLIAFARPPRDEGA